MITKYPDKSATAIRFKIMSVLLNSERERRKDLNSVTPLGRLFMSSFQCHSCC